MMKFFALVALTVFATANAGSVTWGTTTPSTLVSGETPSSLIFVITSSASGAIAHTDGTITVTPSSNIFSADGDTSCTAAATTNDGTTAVTTNPTFKSTESGTAANKGVVSLTASAQKITFTMGTATTTDILAESAKITITCTDNLAANANGGDVTFSAVTTGDTTAVTAQVGYTLTSKPGWTSAARTNIMTGQVGGDLVVKFTPTRAVAKSTDITLTPSQVLFTQDGNVACSMSVGTLTPTFASGNGVVSNTAGGAGGQKIVFSMDSADTDVIAAGSEATITCASSSTTANNIADNGAAADVVTFSIFTAADVTPLTTQTGYTLTEKMVGWTSATRASTVTGADGGILTFIFTPLTLIPHTTGYITLVAPTDFFTANDATTSCAVTVPADGGVTFTTGVTAKTTLKLTLSSAGQLAAGVATTVVCQATNLAANSATAGDVTFSISTSADVGVLAAQTGYTLAAATSAASSTASVGMLTMLALAGVAMRQ